MESLKLRFLLITVFLIISGKVTSAESVTINSTNAAPLFDGHCGSEEWRDATKIELAAKTSIYLMHNRHSVFFCAKGKAEDYTVIDLYIEHPETNTLYNLHASAQLSETTKTDNEWSTAEFWNNKDWGGFWVPYAGQEDTEKGPRTKFLKGSHREIEVLKRKFPAKTWTMMIRLGAIYQDGKYGAEINYPEKALDTDKSTWLKFKLSD